MEARIIEEKKKDKKFKPFKVELTVETIQEARLLYHVGNNDDLLDVVTVNSLDDTISILIGDGDGGFYHM